jgi:hypothetical protein
MKLYVEVDNQCTHNKRSKKPYGDWSATYEFEVKGVSLESNYYFTSEEFEVSFEAKEADIVYVLSLTYSSGDSFGTARGKGEVLMVFKSQTLAYDALRHVEANEQASEFEFLVDSGEKVKVSNVAYGYFENISSVDVTECIIDNKQDDND